MVPCIRKQPLNVGSIDTFDSARENDWERSPRLVILLEVWLMAQQRFQLLSPSKMLYMSRLPANNDSNKVYY